MNTIHPPAPGSPLAKSSTAPTYGNGRASSTTYTTHDGRLCSTPNYPYYREIQSRGSSNPNEKDIGREGASDLAHGANVLGSLLDGLFNTTRPKRDAEEAYHSNPYINAR